MNQDPHTERRLLIAFALSGLLFLLALPFVKRQATQLPAPSEPVAQTVPQSASPPAGPLNLTPSAPQAPAPSAKPKAPVAAGGERTTSVDTDVYHVLFDNRGALVHSWILTQYHDQAHKPLDLVDSSLGVRNGYPMALWVTDSNLRSTLATALFNLNDTTAPDGDRTLRFEWSDGTIDAVKEFSFSQGYVLQVRATVTQNGKPVPASLAWSSGFGDHTANKDVASEQLVQLNSAENKGIETFAAGKVQNLTALAGVFHLAGVQDQYFAAIFLPPEEAQPLSITRFKSPTTSDPSSPQSVGVAVSAANSGVMKLFVGPKKIDLLKSVDPALRGLVDFGWFTFLAEPLFAWMNWTYDHWIHNYGWVILFITLVITVAIFPFRWRSQKSMSKMAALAPQVNAINAKMKKYPLRDPRRAAAQQEMMKLYSDNGVNPLGGCIPMFLPFPLIIGFYRVLQYSIELRQAPWIGYLHDLSSRDPLYLLPLLVMVTQFFSMSLMPNTPGQDPRQARMTKVVMPLATAWFFFYLPSGVNLYYLASNLFGVAQQVFLNRHFAASAANVPVKIGKGPSGGPSRSRR